MYKTSAVYNAFVCHEETSGTKLEVWGGEEVIVPLHHSSAARSTSLPEVRNIWMLLGSASMGMKDAATLENTSKSGPAFLNLV